MSYWWWVNWGWWLALCSHSKETMKMSYRLPSSTYPFVSVTNPQYHTLGTQWSYQIGNQVRDIYFSSSPRIPTLTPSLTQLCRRPPAAASPSFLPHSQENHAHLLQPSSPTLPLHLSFQQLKPSLSGNPLAAPVWESGRKSSPSFLPFGSNYTDSSSAWQQPTGGTSPSSLQPFSGNSRDPPDRPNLSPTVDPLSPHSFQHFSIPSYQLPKPRSTFYPGKPRAMPGDPQPPHPPKTQKRQQKPRKGTLIPWTQNQISVPRIAIILILDV